MRTGIHIHTPLVGSPRARHILEALLVVVLIVLAGFGLAYLLRQGVEPAPAAVSTQPWMERFAEFKQEQAEARALAVVSPVLASTQPWMERFAEFKQEQAELLEEGR